MKNKADLYKPEAAWLKKARVKKLAGGFAFTEGPVWHPGQYFLFSDTPANCIYQLFTNGNLQLYLRNSGLDHKNTDDLSDQVGSNGLVIDRNNNLYICQHGNHAVAVLNEKKELYTLVNQYNDLPFNSPNDITLRSDGTLYFTDPPYGLAGQVLHPETFQPRAGIYKYDFNTVELLGNELQYPNGLCFSPDEQYLYVTTNHPDERSILRYKSFPDGSIRYEDVLLEENADGMTIDTPGNIYLAVKEGILMVSSKGERLSFIELPDTPTNLTWGGGNEEILFVTAGSSVYFIEK